MSGPLVRHFSDCLKCQQGHRNDSYRLCIKHKIDGRSILFHAHDDEDLPSILGRLCDFYPEIWKQDTIYYFYVDMGGFFHSLESPSWLKDKDSIVVSPIDDLDNAPRISLAAVHASFRDNVVLRPHQVEGVDKMIYMEKAYHGGILADEMGLGKTVQTIAVIMRQQPMHKTHACTLIVVPSRGMADQWAEEIRTKTTYGSLPYFLYQQDSIALLEQPCFRIVITTYDRVRSEYKRVSGNSNTNYDDAPLFDIEWHRVVLDESHKVRGNTMLFHSVNALKSKYRWCLTGTPIQNNIAELYPIFNFLRIEMDPIKRREDVYMTNLLEQHMIRRTKNSSDLDLHIPKRVEKRIELEFTPPERALYDYLERLLYYQLTRIRESGDGNSLLTSSAILYLRLKQACGHHMILLEKFPDLIPLAKAGNRDTLMTEIGSVDTVREKNYYDESSDFEQALEIIESYYDQFGNLQQPIDLSQLQKLKFVKHSTKVKWVVKFLQETFSADATDKVVVVSQFVDVIVKIGQVLSNSNIPYQAYHGGMSAWSRKIALRQFNHDPKTRVLVMSLKAGGVGLNLQRANHMVIMDRWWNPATMNQAIARIDRMTQSKDTFVHTVVIKDTIEESLMDNILDKKNALFERIVERQERKGGEIIRDIQVGFKQTKSRKDTTIHDTLLRELDVGGASEEDKDVKSSLQDFEIDFDGKFEEIYKESIKKSRLEEKREGKQVVKQQQTIVKEEILFNQDFIKCIQNIEKVPPLSLKQKRRARQGIVSDNIITNKRRR